MDNKNKILNCALKLFASKGYDSVGVQEIVLAAEITKPTLYHYFGSKLGLLEALLKVQLTPFFEKLEQASVYQGDLPLTLFRITKTYFTFATQEKDFYRLQMALFFVPEASETLKTVTPVFEKQYQVMEQVFLEATKNHGNMKGREKIYAATFIGMINTYVSLSLNGYLVLDDEAIYKAVHQFMHGIFS